MCIYAIDFTYGFVHFHMVIDEIENMRRQRLHVHSRTICLYTACIIDFLQYFMTTSGSIST